MSYFAPDLVTYTDATLGWVFDSFGSLRDVFAQYMPGWAAPARSYATGILSNDVSALVHMVDTPELFGGELRILAAVDFRDGKIVRWVDYWDAAPYPDELYVKFRTPDAQFPRDFKDAEVQSQAAPELVAATTALQRAFAAGDPSAVADLLHTDVVLSDMSLRAQLIGRIEATRYLGRVLADVPYAGRARCATSSAAPRVVGSSGRPGRSMGASWALPPSSSTPRGSSPKSPPSTTRSSSQRRSGRRSRAPPSGSDPDEPPPMHVMVPQKYALA